MTTSSITIDEFMFFGRHHPMFDKAINQGLGSLYSPDPWLKRKPHAVIHFVKVLPRLPD